MNQCHEQNGKVLLSGHEGSEDEMREVHRLADEYIDK